MARAHETRRRSHTSSPLLIGVLCAFAAFGARAAHAQTADASAQRLEVLLEESVPVCDDEQQLARRLIVLGRSAVPELFDELARTWTTAHAPVTPRQKGALVARGIARVLAQLPREAVEQELARRLGAPAERDSRAAALLALGRIGSGDDLARVLHAAEPFASEPGSDEPFERALIDALIGIGERDASLWPNARRLIQSQPAGVRCALLSAAGITASAPAAELLRTTLELVPEQRVEVLMQIGCAAPRLARPLDERLAASVRELLADEKSDVLADVALLCGRLEDSLAAERLLALLSHPSSGVRANALWSLQQISGLQLRADPVRWSRWLADESAWWRGGAEAELRALGASDGARLRTAILEIGRHRLHRDRLAAALVEVLGNEDAGVVQLACAQLRQLRSRLPTQALVGLLDHPQQSVRWSAWTALREITGRDLPEDAAAWRSSVAGS